jgi:hypothetical protein
MNKLGKNKYILIAVFVLLIFAVIAGGTYIYASNQTPKLKGYENIGKMYFPKEGEAVCQAMLPECGVCFGKIVEGYCFVNESTID